jgi:hypothetical protein
VNLTPSVAPIRQFTLKFELNAHDRDDPHRSARLLAQNLASLSKLEMHHSFRLDITFRISEAEQKGYPESFVYPLAVALEAIHPALTDVEGRKEARIRVFLEHYLFDRIEVKDMAGPTEPADMKRWLHFIDTRLLAAPENAGAYSSVERSVAIDLEKVGLGARSRGA